MDHEKGTAETFSWHLWKNGVDLSAAKESITKYLIKPQNNIS
jgi:hypothetical protein